MTTTLEPSETKLATDLKGLASDIVGRAIKGGATAAECVAREGDEFSTVVRLGQVETLKESGSRAIGVRVFFGQRAASTYSSDFSAAGIERMLEIRAGTGEDHFGRSVWGNSGSRHAGSALYSGDLDLYHEDVYSLPGPERIDYARRAEKAALDTDSAAEEFRRRLIRCRNRQQGSRQLARISWRVPPVVLFGLRPFRLHRMTRATCSAITGIRSLVAWPKLDSAEQRRQKKPPGAPFAASARAK
jgi:hypothetical protein